MTRIIIIIIIIIIITIIIITIIISVQFDCHRRYIIIAFAAGSRKYLEAVNFHIKSLMGVVYLG